MAHINIYNSVTGQGQSIEVTGTTWGEVKSQIPGLRSDMRVMIKENKMDVTHDSAEMPVGIGKDSSGNSNGKDYTLFLMASKQKGAKNSGDNNVLTHIKEDIKNYVEAKFKYLEEKFMKSEERALSDIEKEALKKEADRLSSTDSF